PPSGNNALKTKLNPGPFRRECAMKSLNCVKASLQVSPSIFLRAHSARLWNIRTSTTSTERRSTLSWSRLALRRVLLLTVAQVCLAFSAFASCAAPRNTIEAENCLPGTPPSQWYVPGTGSTTIQGFTTDISVNAGETVLFKVSAAVPLYRIDIYRMGYYGGQGGRYITSVSPSSLSPQIQPQCLSDDSTGLIDCGNWAVSASWAVPSTATSGVYLAVLVRLDTGEKSPILFVIRNDSSHSDILMQ